MTTMSMCIQPQTNLKLAAILIALVCQCTGCIFSSILWPAGHVPAATKAAPKDAAATGIRLLLIMGISCSKEVLGMPLQVASQPTLQPSCATPAPSLRMRSTLCVCALSPATCSAWESPTPSCATMMGGSFPRCWANDLSTGPCLMHPAAGLVSLPRTPQSRCGVFITSRDMYFWLDPACRFDCCEVCLNLSARLVKEADRGLCNLQSRTCKLA